MNPLDSLKKTWNDKRKRPWLIGAVVGIAGLAFLAQRRAAEEEGTVEGAGTDTTDAAADDVAFTDELTGDSYTGLPDLYVGPGDSSFDQTDYSALSNDLVELEAQVDEDFRKERDKRKDLRHDLKAQERKNERQGKKIRKLQRHDRKQSRRRDSRKRGRRRDRRGRDHKKKKAA